MHSRSCSRIIGMASLFFLSGPFGLRAQNSYPASGDAHIHGLTIGTGGGGIISNTALGDSALFYNSKAGVNNTAAGKAALMHNTTGTDNTALGYRTLYNNNTGSFNLAAGSGALFGNKSGSYNIALGYQALYHNSGSENTAAGMYSLYTNTTGLMNSSIGYGALYNNTKGSYNSAVGLLCLETNSTGSYNTGAGAYADVASPNLFNATVIGYGAVVTASNSVVFGNTSITRIGGYVGWTNFSDGRYKRNIVRNVPGLAFINKLEPITYTLDVAGIESRLHPHKNSKGPIGLSLPDPMDNPVIQQAMQEKSRIVYSGFIAQDVEKAAQSLGYDFSGVDKPKDEEQSFYGLRYSDFVVPLVKAAQELSTKDDSLTASNAWLDTRLDRIEQLLGIDSTHRTPVVLTLSSARLFQNTPNPANQNTVIRYYLPRTPGAASLQITGMNGQIVEIFALKESGYGLVNFRPGRLSSGTYSYSLFVEGKLIDTKQLILIK